MENSDSQHSSFPSDSFPNYDELPRGKCMGFELYQWEGFWYMLPQLKAAIAAKSHFKAHDDDILLASPTKTGCTWLKALIPSIMNYDADDDHDPLVKNHPNALMPSLEFHVFRKSSNPDLSGMSSPRLFRTHLNYNMLSDSVKNSNCKIVFITRNPNDAFLSMWHFFNTLRKPDQVEPYPMDEAFEGFCNGVHPFGPFLDHTLSYWKESLKNPEKILFLKYEEMKRDTREQVKRLSSFIGKPLVKEEDVDKVIWRCSFDRIKNLDVNTNGVDPWTQIPYRSYFRKGIVGDSKNNLPIEMRDRLDDITSKKLEGSGLDLNIF